MLERLAERYGLGPEAIRALGVLLERLADAAAPTTVHAPARAVDVHLADSLVGMEVEGVRQAARIADLGAGAGLPGLALAVALPGAEVVLVESARRKADFIRDTAAAMGLGNVAVEWTRAEAWEAGSGKCDVVVARALAALGVLCEYAAPLLAPGGVLVCWKGAVGDGEAADGRAAAETLGLSDPEVRPVVPFVGAERRSLWLFRKVSATPPGFPRRPGMATKRPLRATTS